MVYSTLDIFTTVVSTRGRVTHSLKLVVGCSNPVEQAKELGTPEEGSCKTPRKLKSLVGCYNYRGYELGSIAHPSSSTNYSSKDI